jgi:nitrogen regulatory protein PII
MGMVILAFTKDGIALKLVNPVGYKMGSDGGLSMGESSVTKYEALIAIMDYDSRDVLIKLLQKCNTPVFLYTHGYGTAESVIYEILGYGGPKKAISLSLQTEKMSQYILNQLQQEIDFSKPGTGIACTISLSSISSALSMTIMRAMENLEMGSDEVTASPKEAYHLIVTIVNSGYFEQVMEAAKAAGATGGTFLHAHGFGSKEAIKYLGITIQPEKDLVLILAPQEKRRAIMESITHKVGLNTEGMGICFSLPVNHAIGLEAVLENIDEP